jgi:hypothetical protein
MSGKKERDRRRQLRTADPMPPMVRQLAVAARKEYKAASEGDNVEGFLFVTPEWPVGYEVTPDGRVFVHDLSTKEQQT